MKLRLLGAAIAGVLATGLLAAPSQAAISHCEGLYVDSLAYAHGCFDPYGDHILATDRHADGMRAVVEWQTNYGRSGECHDANGANNGEVDCNYNMREDRLVRFRTVVRDGADGRNHYITAYSPWLSID